MAKPLAWDVTALTELSLKWLEAGGPVGRRGEIPGGEATNNSYVLWMGGSLTGNPTPTCVCIIICYTLRRIRTRAVCIILLWQAKMFIRHLGWHFSNYCNPWWNVFSSPCVGMWLGAVQLYLTHDTSTKSLRKRASSVVARCVSWETCNFQSCSISILAFRSHSGY